MNSPIEDLANQICSSQPPGTDQILPEVLIAILVEVLHACTEEASRRAMLLSGKRPNGMVAKTVRRQVKSRLPELLQVPAVVDQIMSATCKAAENKGLWSVIYAFKDLKPTTFVSDQEFEDD